MLWDFRQHLDIANLNHNVNKARLTDAEQWQQINRLLVTMQQLLLTNQAMWELLQEALSLERRRPAGKNQGGRSKRRCSGQ